MKHTWKTERKVKRRQYKRSKKIPPSRRRNKQKSPRSFLQLPSKRGIAISNLPISASKCAEADRQGEEDGCKSDIGSETAHEE